MPATFYRQVITANTLVHTGPGALVAVLVSHSQSAAQTVTIYDNTAGSGTVLFSVILPPNIPPFFVELSSSLQLPFSTGLYVSPATATMIVWAIGR